MMNKSLYKKIATYIHELSFHNLNLDSADIIKSSTDVATYTLLNKIVLEVKDRGRSFEVK